MEEYNQDLHLTGGGKTESAKAEIAYRPEMKIESVEHVLRDTINTALLIARKDILKTDDEKARFSEIHTGINQFRHFVFLGRFDILEAQVASAKAAYLAAIILTDHNEKLKTFHLATNEVIARYHELYKIEQAFRVAKSDLETRPIFHFKEEPIKLHLLICFMA